MSRAVAVCVTYNNATTVTDLMESLSRQDGAIDRLVLVDNGSSDGTVAIAEDARSSCGYPVTIHRGENVGFARGIETALGLVENSSDPVLVINPDVVLADGILPTMLDLLRSRPEAAIVSAPLMLSTGEEDPASRRRLPRLGASAAYAVLGRLTPNRIRYNRVSEAVHEIDQPTGARFSRIEATTGALMLVNPAFRDATTGIFDTAYWMYGEDLQLCADAAREGRSVLMLEVEGCVHIKGVSSGWPRSRRSDAAFHRALYLYYRKNLDRNPVQRGVVATAVATRYALSRTAASVSGLRRAALRHAS